MLGKGMLAELKALARNHGLATGSQTVPNSVVETAIVQGLSPPKEPAQRKKLVLKRPKRKAPQVIHEEEEEDDEATEDGLVSKKQEGGTFFTACSTPSSNLNASIDARSSSIIATPTGSCLTSPSGPTGHCATCS